MSATSTPRPAAEKAGRPSSALTSAAFGSSRRARRWIVTAAAALVAFLVNVPLLNSILVSFKPTGEIAGNPLALPAEPTLAHYANVLYASGYDFPRFFANSAMIASGTVVAVLVIGIPATYAIIRLGFGGRWVVNAASGLRLLPAIFFIVPFFLLFTTLGLQDTIVGLIAANTFMNLPLGIILLAAGLRDLPSEVEEAAAVDGAGVLRTLGSVVVPMLAPTIVAVAVLAFIFSWDDYLFALVLSSTKATPVTLGAANYVTSTGIRWGDISAASFLSALPPLLFAVFAQRYLVSGLSAGAVKG